MDSQNVSTIGTIGHKVSDTKNRAVIAASAAAGVLASAAPSLATPTVADLWTAVDTSTLSGSVLTALTALVGVRLAFLVYKFVKRTMGTA